MIPYIVTFSAAYVFALLAEKGKKTRKNKKVQSFLLFIATSILSILAALRGKNIGTDIQTYVIRFFEGARGYNSFIKYLSFYPFDYVEPGYKLLNYIVSRFTDDIRVMHFVISFFDISFVTAYLWENRKKMSLSLGLLTFMLMQYNLGFNAVRQTMAVCICLYSFNSARDRKLIKFVVLMVLAFLFHRSSLIMIISYPLVWVFNKKTRREKNRLVAIISVVVVGVLICINPIVSLLIRIGLFPVKFSHYIGDSFSLARLSAFFFLIPIYVIFKMYEKIYYDQDSFNAILFLYVLLWPIVAQLDSVSDQFGRMAYFFMVANIGMYAQLPVLQKNVRNKNNIRIIRIISVIFLLFYWIVNYYIWGTGQTVPYIFS